MLAASSSAAAPAANAQVGADSALPAAQPTAGAARRCVASKARFAANISHFTTAHRTAVFAQLPRLSETPLGAFVI